MVEDTEESEGREMKYECKSCGLECSIEANFEPTVCLKTGIICYGWHKVIAPAPKPLPEAVKIQRVRWWTFEEAPVEFKTKDDVFRLFYSCSGEWKYQAEKEDADYTLAEVAKEQIQIDGSPCGVLEVAEVGK